MSVFKKFPRTFWVANVMELFERWAWYGIFASLAVYMVTPVSQGGLEWSQVEKSRVISIITGALYFLPIITGTLADRIGYKKVLIASYAIMCVGYYSMAYITDFWPFVMAFGFMAFGAALFKPVISATISKTTTTENSSIGFGIFYMIVNIGGFLGPIATMSLIKGDGGWTMMFIASAISISINIILVLFFFKEPERDENAAQEPLGELISKSFKNIFEALSDIKLTILLVIFVFFWTVFNQIYYTLPNFIVQWIDTRSIITSVEGFSPWLAEWMTDKNGQVAFQLFTNMNSLAIILLQLIISSAVARMRAINSMISGILVCGVGIGFSMLTNNPYYVVVGIIFFSIGEMASSPKFTEYVGSLAPNEKKGLYMGTSFLPHFVGNIFAGFISGDLYEVLSDKVKLTQKFAAEKGLEISTDLPNDVFFNKVAESMGMTDAQLTQTLWDTYNPGSITYIIFALAIFTVTCLFFYDKFLLRPQVKEKEAVSA
ncbi:MFS transporter [Aureibacter tunicatorum]|uniref:Dipeptide/tripeptide permease n=1 Tax=Aureibacter tunicatorum TaxID=866807 RepID=A0AAE4BQ29_9BACT|nr:MFS transporter [Aureibacter tunicatorum]MDR6238659.1 dipeptide/tripeptide permease [Aureibacter tunicatorum]BDD05410.1 MFS transporter [Aureibacter tunicatorum]